MDNSISDDNSIKTVAAAAVVAASTATAAVGTPTITKSNDGSQCSIDDDHKIGADDNGKSKTVKATNTTATHIAPNDTDNKSKEYSLRRNDGNYKRITSKCISRARDLVHKCQSDPGGSRVSSTSPSSSSSAAATQSSIAALNSAINRSSQRSLRHQSPGCSSNTASATATTTRKCVLTLDGYNYVIGKMQRFRQILGSKPFSIIGMIHVKALPGTPKYDGNFNAIIEQAKHEANIYKRHNIDAILVENMHDIPYIQNEHIGPEVIASMARVSAEIKQIFPNTPCGIQVLACGNCQALAIAKAANLQFIRAEGFVFSHVADEGFTDACAGHLLRYRKQIDAEHILIFTDLKKKHSSHSITNDVSLLETVHAAEFFLTDGIILTGTATGCAVKGEDLESIYNKCKSPILIGSGVTNQNVSEYFSKSNAAIIGSYFKRDGHWDNELCDGENES